MSARLPRCRKRWLLQRGTFIVRSILRFPTSVRWKRIDRHPWRTRRILREAIRLAIIALRQADADRQRDAGCRSIPASSLSAEIARECMPWEPERARLKPSKWQIDGISYAIWARRWNGSLPNI